MDVFGISELNGNRVLINMLKDLNADIQANISAPQNPYRDGKFDSTVFQLLQTFGGRYPELIKRDCDEISTLLNQLRTYVQAPSGTPQEKYYKVYVNLCYFIMNIKDSVIRILTKVIADDPFAKAATTYSKDLLLETIDTMITSTQMEVPALVVAHAVETDPSTKSIYEELMQEFYFFTEYIEFISKTITASYPSANTKKFLTNINYNELYGTFSSFVQFYLVNLMLHYNNLVASPNPSKSKTFKIIPDFFTNQPPQKNKKDPWEYLRWFYDNFSSSIDVLEVSKRIDDQIQLAVTLVPRILMGPSVPGQKGTYYIPVNPIQPAMPLITPKQEVKPQVVSVTPTKQTQKPTQVKRVIPPARKLPPIPQPGKPLIPVPASPPQPPQPTTPVTLVPVKQEPGTRPPRHRAPKAPLPPGVEQMPPLLNDPIYLLTVEPSDALPPPPSENIPQLVSVDTSSGSTVLSTVGLDNSLQQTLALLTPNANLPPPPALPADSPPPPPVVSVAPQTLTPVANGTKVILKPSNYCRRSSSQRYEKLVHGVNRQLCGIMNVVYVEGAVGANKGSSGSSKSDFFDMIKSGLTKKFARPLQGVSVDWDDILKKLSAYSDFKLSVNMRQARVAEIARKISEICKYVSLFFGERYTQDLPGLASKSLTVATLPFSVDDIGKMVHDSDILKKIEAGETAKLVKEVSLFQSISANASKAHSNAKPNEFMWSLPYIVKPIINEDSSPLSDVGFPGMDFLHYMETLNFDFFVAWCWNLLFYMQNRCNSLPGLEKVITQTIIPLCETVTVLYVHCDYIMSNLSSGETDDDGRIENLKDDTLARWLKEKDIGVNITEGAKNVEDVTNVLFTSYGKRINSKDWLWFFLSTKYFSGRGGKVFGVGNGIFALISIYMRMAYDIFDSLKLVLDPQLNSDESVLQFSILELEARILSLYNEIKAIPKDNIDTSDAFSVMFWNILEIDSIPVYFWHVRNYQEARSKYAVAPQSVITDENLERARMTVATTLDENMRNGYFTEVLSLTPINTLVRVTSENLGSSELNMKTIGEHFARFSAVFRSRSEQYKWCLSIDPGYIKEYETDNSFFKEMKLDP
jgi:hypothetical protein